MTAPSPLLIHLIAGARPNFMKVAPLYRELLRCERFKPTIIHTGQHYDSTMSNSFFTALRLPSPTHSLGVGSGSHAEQTARVMLAYEPICRSERPALVVVVGDVNSTLAACLVAAKLGVPVAHVEAGLRSFDRTMPEEINRLATDSIADLHFVPSPDGVENLRREGSPPERIFLVGNIMIDSLEMAREEILRTEFSAKLHLDPGRFGLVTLHRPSNVDSPTALARLVSILTDVATDHRLVFPVHPRTQKQLELFHLWDDLAACQRITLTEPLGYLEFMNLLFNARFAITDSGGIQEETTHLGIPCLTMRANTERPITVTCGTNRLTSAERLRDDLREALHTPVQPRRPELWDGRAAERIAGIIAGYFDTSPGSSSKRTPRPE